MGSSPTAAPDVSDSKTQALHHYSIIPKVDYLSESHFLHLAVINVITMTGTQSRKTESMLWRVVHLGLSDNQ